MQQLQGTFTNISAETLASSFATATTSLIIPPEILSPFTSIAKEISPTTAEVTLPLK